MHAIQVINRMTAKDNKIKLIKLKAKNLFLKTRVELKNKCKSQFVGGKILNKNKPVPIITGKENKNTNTQIRNNIGDIIIET